MEYLEGETLNQRIQGKPFQLDEIFDIAVQVAEGLDAAHSEVTIHRDLKPAQTEESAKEAPRKIKIIPNWFEGLKDRVPD